MRTLYDDRKVCKINASHRVWRLAKQKAWYSLGRLGLHFSPRNVRPFIATSNLPKTRAIEWIHAYENPKGGIYVSSGDYVSYPEVTGYLIPTLLDYSQKDLASRLAHWLVRTQRRDGSFPSPDGFPHVFDTGQALRGLLAAVDFVPEARQSGKRAARYLFDRMISDGAGGFDVDSVWVRRYHKSIPMSIHMYVLPVLRQAADIFQEPGYALAAANCVEYYVKSGGSLQVDTLTHFLAYELEALIDIGRDREAMPILQGLRRLQHDDGSIRGLGGVTWVCAPGMAQLACCWYKVGDRDPADKALRWLEEQQMPSGGFRGSYGENASYFPNVEIPWAAKFYLDAARLRDFDHQKSLDLIS